MAQQIQMKVTAADNPHRMAQLTVNKDEKTLEIHLQSGDWATVNLDAEASRDVAEFLHRNLVPREGGKHC